MNKNIERIFDYILISAFCLAITVPLIIAFAQEPAEDSEVERRPLAHTIDLWGKSVNAMIDEVEAYITDQLGFREQLVLLNNLINVKVFGTSPVNSIVIGKEDWFFLNLGIEESLGLNPFDNSTLEQMKFNLELRRDTLAKYDIDYLYVIAPDKHSIYPEYLPEQYSTSVGPSRADQFVEYMTENSDVAILDLRAPLLKAKGENEYDLYYKYDSHWNRLGASVGAIAIFDAIQQYFPELNAKNIQTEIVGAESQARNDMTLMVGLGGILTDTVPIVIPVPQCIDGMGGLPPGTAQTYFCEEGTFDGISFQDSFGTALHLYFAQGLRKSQFVHGNFALSKSELLEFEPDIVIDESVERGLEIDIMERFMGELEFLDLEHSLEFDVRKNLSEAINAEINIDDEFLSIDSTTDQTQLIFDTPTIPAHSTVGVRINSTFPESRSYIQLFYGNSETSFDDERKVRRLLDPRYPESDYYFIFKTDIPIEHIRFDPVAVPGDYIIETIEIRITEPDTNGE